MSTSSKIKDYYVILGVPRTATTDEIKKAFRSKAKTYHPDVCKLPNAHDIFIEIGKAYEILKDTETRRDYDRILGEQTTIPNSSQNNYSTNARNNFNKAEQQAQNQAQKYAAMSVEDFFNSVLGFTYEVTRTILVGEKNKPDLDFFDYIKYGFMGILLTICVIISFTGIGAIPGIAFGYLITKSLIKNNSFVGIVPFILCTLVADVVVVILLILIIFANIS